MKTAGNILIGLLVGLVFADCKPSVTEEAQNEPSNAAASYSAAQQAFVQDSVQMGEQILHSTIRLAQEESDLHTLYLAQSRLAESLSWSNTAEALDMAQQALATYERRPDSERNHIILLDFVATYASQLAFNDDLPFDEALDYARRANELAVAARDTMADGELICQTLTTLANIYWATDDLDEALRCARKAEAEAPPHLLLGVQQVLGRTLVALDSLAEAEAIYRRMQPGNDIQAAYIVQSNLAKLALQRQDTEAAKLAIDEAFDQAEELYFNALRQKDDYYRTTLAREVQNEHLRYTLKLHRHTLAAILIALALLIVATSVIIRTRMKFHAQQRQSAVWTRKHEVDRYIRETTIQRERLHQRDATIAFLQNFILQRSAVKQKIDASSERHIKLYNHEWTEIERTLNAIDGNRITLLRERYPDLREEDVRLCILIRLRLTNRAIGNIYAISISAVQHRKLKIKKEVMGEDDPTISLEQLLDQLHEPAAHPAPSSYDPPHTFAPSRPGNEQNH
ncbi:MAG: tetratricopeptide repeat protein [Bacteroidaceae bacterium]|nr:tetratricopeptide repeat protein [Bacteroidaceae bacterium]